MALKNGANNIARRIAVVTGTNRGIGFEICKQLSEKGVVTIMTSRDEAKGKKAMNDLLNILAKSGVDAKDKLFFHPLDVVSNDSIDKFKKYLVDNFNQLDILVNNAGIYVDKWDEESFKQTMETNVYGPIRFTDALLPLMKEKKFGRIVTLSSGLGNLSNVSKTYKELITKPDLTIPELFKVPFMANDSQKKQFYGAYCLSKAMVDAHARVLQKELNADGYNNIHVAAIDPGWVQTDMGGPNAPKLVHEGARGPVDFVTKDI